MSDYKVELSIDAQNDIVSTRDYIRDRLKNNSAAERFLKDTDEAVCSLEKYPYDHMVREDPHHAGTVDKRQFNYRKNYCIFCIIKEDQELVRVIQIAYTGQDFDKQPDRIKQ
jgi:plasmid stabilization system protein ParE